VLEASADGAVEVPLRGGSQAVLDLTPAQHPPEGQIGDEGGVLAGVGQRALPDRPVRGAGLKAEGIDLDAFALVRMLASVGEMGYDGARVYCHLGGITNLAIALGTSCLFTRPLSTAWQEDVDHTAAALAEEIRLSIDYYLDQPEAPRVADVLLSGPGSKAEGLADQLSMLMDLPVAVAEPLGQMTAGDLPEGEDPTRHTVAAGLAIGAAA